MTLDGSIHHVGTKPNQFIIPVMLEAIGGLCDYQVVLGIGFGMLLIMLWNSMRVKQPYYRWRVKPANGSDSDG